MNQVQDFALLVGFQIDLSVERSPDCAFSQCRPLEDRKQQLRFFVVAQSYQSGAH
jgi:hypothetical protein